MHSGRTIGVCARFSDPGSISRQIEFFLKIKEHDIPISDAAKLRHRTLPASPPAALSTYTQPGIRFSCETAASSALGRESDRGRAAFEGACY